MLLLFLRIRPEAEQAAKTITWRLLLCAEAEQASACRTLSAVVAPVGKLRSQGSAFSLATHSSALLRVLSFVSILLVKGIKSIVQAF